eukprot:gene19537-biopygen22047
MLPALENVRSARPCQECPTLSGVPDLGWGWGWGKRRCPRPVCTRLSQFHRAARVRLYGGQTIRLEATLYPPPAQAPRPSIARLK